MMLGSDSFSFSFKRKILDIFAMKIIASNKRPTFNSSNPELKELIKEKKENHKLLGKMQGFQFKLINSEFENPPQYKYTVTKKEYYENCKILLEKIKTLIAPEATNLHDFYNNIISSIDETVSLLDNMGYLDNTLSEEDFAPNSEINFLDILNDFSLRVHDKLDLAVLTKQIESVFKNSDTLKKLGVELIPGIKEKRSPSGYVANFIYIKTLVGIIECQLQSEHEYKAGNYGYAAHTNMEGKKIKPMKIPDINDKKAVEEFYNYVSYISPISYLAQLDSIEQDRVVITEASEYQNYKNIIGQVPKGSKVDIYLKHYFDELYLLRKKIFKHNGSEMGIVRSDILSYINSDEFKNLPNIIAKNKEDNKSR